MFNLNERSTLVVSVTPETGEDGQLTGAYWISGGDESRMVGFETVKIEGRDKAMSFAEGMVYLAGQLGTTGYIQQH